MQDRRDRLPCSSLVFAAVAALAPPVLLPGGTRDLTAEFSAVLELCARDDRHPDRRVFLAVTADRLRTAIARACTAAGVPTFSPHDLRHRRISLLHLRGVPWATIGQHVGQRDLAVTANTYSHVLSTDETELDYRALVV